MKKVAIIVMMLAVVCSSVFAKPKKAKKAKKAAKGAATYQDYVAEIDPSTGKVWDFGINR